MNRLTTAFECVPAFALVPINRPRIPCSNCQPLIGAYSIPNTSRWRSRRYSVNDSVFQSLISRFLQSFAEASLRLVIRSRLLSVMLYDKRMNLPKRLRVRRRTTIMMFVDNAHNILDRSSLIFHYVDSYVLGVTLTHTIYVMLA